MSNWDGCPEFLARTTDPGKLRVSYITKNSSTNLPYFAYPYKLSVLSDGKEESEGNTNSLSQI